MKHWFNINSMGELIVADPTSKWGDRLVNDEELSQRQKRLLEQWVKAYNLVEDNGGVCRVYAGIRDRDDKKREEYVVLSTEYSTAAEIDVFWKKVEEWAKTNGARMYEMDSFIEEGKTTYYDGRVEYDKFYGKRIRHESIDFDVMGKSDEEILAIIKLMKDFDDSIKLDELEAGV